MTFGERVKQARLANGLKQGEVAISAGFREKSAICEIEKQRTFNATTEKIINLCKALNTDPNTLLGWEEEKPERTESTYTEKIIVSVLHGVLAEYLSKELTDTITISVIEALNGKGR